MKNIDPRIIQICDTLSVMTSGAVSSDDIYSLIDDCLDAYPNDNEVHTEDKLTAVSAAWKTVVPAPEPKA